MSVLDDLLHYSGASQLGRRDALDRFSVQIPLLVVITLAVQIAVVVFALPDALLSRTTSNTLSATFAANVLSMLVYREMRRVPGTRRVASILPAFLINYLVLILIILIARVPYSSILGAIGFVVGFSLTWILNARARSQYKSISMFYVPSDRTVAFCEELRDIDFHRLESPGDLARIDDNPVVVDLREDLDSDWERAIASAVVRGVSVFHVKQLRESLTGMVRIDAMSENSFGTLQPSSSYLHAKRVIDMLVSVPTLILLSPVMLVVAIAIRLDSPGPAIFRHQRMGHRGVPFHTLKFRTMAMRAPDGLDRDSQMTQASDPRITRIGRFLRKTRLDEMPQLINVIRGEMSLIGPRPEAMALSKWYDENLDFYEYRHIVRPGVTGWAQVNQGHVTQLDDVFVKLQYDFYYIKNISAWLDLLILFRTLQVMISGKGAV